MVRQNQLTLLEPALVQYTEDQSADFNTAAFVSNQQQRGPYQPNLGRNVNRGTGQFRPYRPQNNVIVDPRLTTRLPGRRYEDVHREGLWRNGWYYNRQPRPFNRHRYRRWSNFSGVNLATQNDVSVDIDGDKLRKSRLTWRPIVAALATAIWRRMASETVKGYKAT
ncbi:hypothetical protein MKX08_003444 [Trichoderma sp. CBMAI-0020]|nr:hypothetical protein MKX08_003444 [Trichoderma sp. CBMAI-0020]